MPGPLPNAQRRRRNPPTIPTTELPAKGRKGPAPKCPYDLAQAGQAWWKWAWGTPQACKWDAGALYAVARRAVLEDELAALAEAEMLDYEALLGMSDDEAVQQLDWLLRNLQSRATGSTTLMREMRELDNRFGLTPKGMADLRWSIAVDEVPAKRPAAVRALRAVGPQAS